jgi:O-antigen ligase
MVLHSISLRHQLLLTVAMLAPSVALSSTFGLRPEICLAALFLVGMLLTGRNPRHAGPLSWRFGLLAASILCSTMFAALVLQQPVGINDAFEIPKVGIYYMYYWVARETRISVMQFHWTYVVTVMLFTLSALFGIAQYFNAFGVNEWLTPYYASTQLEGLLSGGRVVGTTSNPNDLGLLMLCGLCVTLLPQFAANMSLSFVWLNRIALVACLYALLLTNSRTMIAIGALMICLIVGSSSWKAIGRGRQYIRLIVMLVLLASVVAIVLNSLPQSWFGRMTSGIEYDVDTSGVARIENWKRHWGLFMKSPFLGWGPAKGLVSYNVDNEWMLFLTRYGILGTVALFVLGKSFFSSSRLFVRQTAFPELKVLNQSLQLFLVLASLAMVTSGIYHYQQLMAVTMVLFGLAHRRFTLEGQTFVAEPVLVTT